MGARKWLDWVGAAGQYHGYVVCHVDDAEIRACPFVFCPYLIAVWCARLLVPAAHRLLIGGRITSSGTAAGQMLSRDGVVAISGDGTTVAAGSQFPSDVQVWKWDGSNYTPLGQPIAIPAVGSAVKLSTDGQTLAVAVEGAPGAIVLALRWDLQGLFSAVAEAPRLLQPLPHSSHILLVSVPLH